MSSPQIEDGFTAIAHELLEAFIIYPFTDRQRKIMLLIMRKTYGYGKKSDDLAMSFIEKQTRLAKSHISTTLKELEAINAIKKEAGRYGFVLSIQSHYKQWLDWDSNWDFVGDSVKKQKPHKKQDQSDIDLTTEQIECWELAKKHNYWQGSVATQADFLKTYLRHNSGLKTQYEDGRLKFEVEEKQKYRGKKKPADFEFQDFDDVPDTENGDFINGEFEVME